MSLKNKVTLIGNVGNDIELKSLQNGFVANVSLATSEKYKNKEGQIVVDTEWHKLVFFGKIAELVGKYVKKGSKIAIEGKLKYEEWTDKEIQKKRFTTKIIVSEVLFLDNKDNDSVPF